MCEVMHTLNLKQATDQSTTHDDMDLISYRANCEVLNKS